MATKPTIRSPSIISRLETHRNRLRRLVSVWDNEESSGQVEICWTATAKEGSDDQTRISSRDVNERTQTQSDEANGRHGEWGGEGKRRKWLQCLITETTDTRNDSQSLCECVSERSRADTHTHTHTHTHTQRRKKVKIKRFKDGTSSSSVVSVMQIAITHTNTEGQTNRWQMKQTGESSACANEEKTDRPAKLRMMSSPFPSKNSKSILFCSSVKSSTTGTSLDYEREREGEKMLGKGWRCGVRCCRANHVYAHLHRHTQKIGAVHRRAAGRCTHAQNKIIKQGAATGRANSLTKACFFKNRERK